MVVRLEAVRTGPAPSAHLVSSKEHFWGGRKEQGRKCARVPSQRAAGPAAPTRLGATGAGWGPRRGRGGSRRSARSRLTHGEHDSPASWGHRDRPAPPPRVPASPPPPRDKLSGPPPACVPPPRPPRPPALRPRAWRRDRGAQGPPRAWLGAPPTILLWAPRPCHPRWGGGTPPASLSCGPRRKEHPQSLQSTLLVWPLSCVYTDQPGHSHTRLSHSLSPGLLSIWWTIGLGQLPSTHHRHRARP